MYYFTLICTVFLIRCFGYCCKANIYHARVVNFGRLSKTQEFPVNKINNQKYNILTFIPIVSYY